MASVSGQRCQQAGHQLAPLGEALDLDMLIQGMQPGTAHAEARGLHGVDTGEGRVETAGLLGDGFGELAKAAVRAGSTRAKRTPPKQLTLQSSQAAPSKQ